MKTWCKIAGSPEIPHTAYFYAQRNLIPINSDKGFCVVSLPSLVVVVWIKREP